MASSAPTTPTTTPSSTSPTPTTSTPSTPTTSTTPTPTTPSTTPTTSTPSDTSTPTQTTTPNSGTTSAVAAPNPGSTDGSSSSTDTSLTVESSSTLSVASTMIGEAVTVATSSNGQVYTTTVAFTTTIPPGTVVTNVSSVSPSNRSNTGAIVGGAVGGVGGLIILAALVFFCLRKRRKDEFDGNFDPAFVGSGKGGGGGTLPKIDLGENGLLMGSNGERVYEDDGMGGRLGAGPEGGGIITPYAFQPAPVGGTAIGGQQHQNQQSQMQQMSNIGVAAADGVGVAAAASTAAGYPNEKRARQQQQQYAQHTPNTSVSSGSLYPSSSTANQHMIPNSVSPEPYSVTSDGSSSFGGSGSGAIYYQTMGRGPSPGHSVLSSSSGGGGRNAKEMEAMGRVVNPDEGRGQQQQQIPDFQQAYLENGPGLHYQQQQQQQQQRQHITSSSTSSAVSPQSHSPSVSRAGTAVVVHADGGRVVIPSKGEEAEGEEREVLREIPPTYDSIPHDDVRREN